MTLEEQIQKLTAERDAARADLKVVGECVGGEPLAVRGLVESMDAVIKERDAALRSCAEMRDVAVSVKATLAYVAYNRLPLGNTVFDTLPEHWQLKVIKDLDVFSTDCGKDYVHKSELEQANAACAEMRAHCEQALEMLCQGSSGLKYDPSWIRPKHIPIVEMRDACIQAYHQLNKVILTDCGKGYVKAESLRCFACDDGHTPLYCLNCARDGYHHDDEWKMVVEALDRLLIHAIEFYGDWNKGDFPLGKLAQCDMLSMAEQFNAAKQALAHAEKLTSQ